MNLVSSIGLSIRNHYNILSIENVCNQYLFLNSIILQSPQLIFLKYKYSNLPDFLKITLQQNNTSLLSHIESQLLLWGLKFSIVFFLLKYFLAFSIHQIKKNPKSFFNSFVDTYKLFFLILFCILGYSFIYFLLLNDFFILAFFVLLGFTPILFFTTVRFFDFFNEVII